MHICINVYVYILQKGFRTSIYAITAKQMKLKTQIL